jgi:tRNA A37 threonylcarbamoyltransferase TsaD
LSLILGIESTCDETAAAVVADGIFVRSNTVASQVEVHAKYRGVVPEIASRAHLENILPVLREAIAAAGLRGFDDLDAIAIANRPGLIGSLLIGVTAAKTLAWALGKPLVAVDHVHAHLYSVLLKNDGRGKAEVRRSPFPSPGTPGEGHGGGRSGGRRPITIPHEDAKLPPPQPCPGVPGEGERGAAGAKSEEVSPGVRVGLTGQIPLPTVGLVCSGGHTALYRIGEDWRDVQLIGSTIDDAVGEAYDKVAAILGLGYPGGPILDGLAVGGDPAAIRFPRTLLDRESLDFSFSGLKTAVLYHVRGVPRRGENVKASQVPAPTGQHLQDIAASFQAACIDVLVEKIGRAVARTGARSVVIGGGVSANRGLRDAMSRFPLPVFFPSLSYCTDNAAMSAGLAQVYLDAGIVAGLDLDAVTFSQFVEQPPGL